MDANIHAQKDESLTSDQANGVSREQAEIFNLSLLCPITPLAATKGGAA